MVGCAMFHTGILIPILATLTFGVDMFIRSIVMARVRYPRTGNLRIISDTVVEVSFPKIKGFDYNPGQYLYIAIPELSWLEWHPFSISSSPKQKTVTLHIRKAGDWTSALHSLARKKSEVSILLEGPYGSLGVDILGDRYKMIMLFSGGIGITPMQSLCDQLLHEQAKGRRNLQKLKFIWTERDPVLLERTEFVRRSSTLNTEPDAHVRTPPTAMKGRVGIASRLLAAVPPGSQTDTELEAHYASMNLVLEHDEIAKQFEVTPTSRRRHERDIVSEGETSFADDHTSAWKMRMASGNVPLHNMFELHVHLTGDATPNEAIPFARRGRPDIKKLFLEMKAEAVTKGEKYIAVCVCAPPALSALCQKACIVYSGSQVQFDYHSEPTA